MGTETPKTVIITGVTRGLGEALAGRFIEAGHRVWGCGRSQSDIQELKARWGVIIVLNRWMSQKVTRYRIGWIRS